MSNPVIHPSVLDKKTPAVSMSFDTRSFAQREHSEIIHLGSSTYYERGKDSPKTQDMAFQK
jgi:hypothetical protein